MHPIVLRTLKVVGMVISFLLTSCVSMSDLQHVDGPGDWTIFRGSPSLSGYIERPLPDNPQLAWTFKNDVRTVASPIIYNGNAYTCDRKGVIRGINAEGLEFFQYNLDTPVEASFVIRDSVLYVGRIDGHITALSINNVKAAEPDAAKAAGHDGVKVLWDYETLGQISASPNLIEDENSLQLLVGSYDNNMYTLDAFDGGLNNCFPSGYYINGAVALWREYMVYGGCDAWLRIVNTDTGMQTDSLELNAYVPASPAIFDDYAYVSDYNGNLYEVHIVDGSFARHRLLRTASKDVSSDDGGVVSMPSVSPSSVVLLTGDRTIRCLDRKTGNERWSKVLRGDTGESSPLICRDKVIVCTKDGHVSILQASNGKELWHFEAGEQILASPAIVNGGFYILTSRGKLFYFRK